MMSNSTTTASCNQCEALKRRGKFLRKCPHSRKQSSQRILLELDSPDSQDIDIKQLIVDSHSSEEQSYIAELFNVHFPSIPSGQVGNIYNVSVEEDSNNNMHTLHILISDTIDEAVLILTGLFAVLTLDIRSGAIVHRVQDMVWSGTFQVLGDRPSLELVSNDLDNVLSAKSPLEALLIEIFCSTARNRPMGVPYFKLTSLDSPDPSVINILGVDADDSIGFLFFLSTALWLRKIPVQAIMIGNIDSQVKDFLYISRTEHNIDELDQITTIVSSLQIFTHFLSNAPNPFQAIQNFDKLLSSLQISSSLQLLTELMIHERTLESLALVLGSSMFLSNHSLVLELLRHSDIEAGSDVYTSQEYIDRLRFDFTVDLMKTIDLSGFRQKMLQWRNNEVFSIYASQLLFPDSEAFSLKLNNLAEAMLVVSTSLCCQWLEFHKALKWPMNSLGDEYNFAVCAMGKFGSMDMGFASDYAMCIFDSGDGTIDSESQVYFSKLMKLLSKLFRDSTSEFQYFDLDLRLRPFGSKSPEVTSLEMFKTYYGPGGSAQQFERQALIRLRVVSGTPSFKEEINRSRDEFVYSTQTFDVDYAIHLRNRQRDELASSSTFNVKYGTGGLIDIEYSIQYLQMVHGKDNPCLRTTMGLTALHHLKDMKLIDPSLVSSIKHAYGFLRKLIDALRLVHNNPKDLALPPLDPKNGAFIALSRRMGYSYNVNGLMTDIQIVQNTAGTLFKETIASIRDHYALQNLNT